MSTCSSILVLENPMDRRAWEAKDKQETEDRGAMGLQKSQTRLSQPNRNNIIFSIVTYLIFHT